MPTTVIRGTQVLDGSIQRPDLDVTTVGKAVVAKLVQGTNITLSSTGADSGTGDVTISAPGAGVAGAPGQPAYTNATAPFTVPAAGSNVTVNVADTSWMALGEVVWVAGGAGVGKAGTMRVTAIGSPTQVTLQA